MKTFRTHYDNLQVAETASLEVIKGAYKFLSQKWHPDKNPDNRAEAERITRIINEAYSVLSDPQRRKEHDEWIRGEKERANHRHKSDNVPPTQASAPPQLVDTERPSRFLKRSWLMLLFTASLVMILGIFPYQLTTGGFKWSYLAGVIFWLVVGHYAYMALFHPENIVAERRRVVEAQRKASKFIWIAALVSWPIWCLVFLMFYGEYGVEFSIVASTVAAMLVGVVVFVAVIGAVK